MNATITITIIAKTHRDACLAGLGEADGAAYDETFPAYVDRLTAAAGRAGFALQVNAYDLCPYSYSVDAADPADEQAAHDFMQSPAADFWEQF